MHSLNISAASADLIGHEIITSIKTFFENFITVLSDMAARNSKTQFRCLKNA